MRAVAGEEFRDVSPEFAGVLNRELSLDDLIRGAPDVPALQDDRPVNEYFLLRRLQNREYLSTLWKRFLARVDRGR